MAKQPKNSGKKWTAQDEATLRKLINGNTPTPLIAYKLGRTESAIYQKALDLNLSTKPVNKSPYNRKNK